MSDCVVDASALVLALGGKTSEALAVRSRLLQSFVHAPHLIDAELGNAVRRHEREARLSQEESLQVLRAARAVVDRRYPHAGPLAERA